MPLRGFPGGSVVKNLPTNAGYTRDSGLVPESRFHLEGNDNPSSIFAWEIPWIEKPGRLQSMGAQKTRRGLSNCTTTMPLRARRKKKPVELPTQPCCCCCLVSQSCPTLCDPMNCNTPAFPVLHYLPEFAQTHVH